MSKIKLTKNELKNQKDSLKMYKRYLPTLQLKKQQLQTEIRKVKEREEDVRVRKEALFNEFTSWIEVFGEKLPVWDNLICVKSIKTRQGNIAGVAIPFFDGAEFEINPYDLFATPLWVDKACVKMKELMMFDLEYSILEKQVSLLEYELRVTTQRVNLFEKVKIPETRENIKKITIYLGDQQTAAVVRGKISKNKLVKVAAS